MKKTNHMPTLLRRLTATALLLVVLLGTLVSCSSTGSGATTLNWKVSESVITDEHSLTADQANQILKLLLSVQSNFSTDLGQALVAAYRGYDMLAEDFDPKADAPQKDPDLTALRELIVKANDSAKVEDKIPLKAADATEEQTNNIDLDQLNDRDLLTLVEATQLEADLTKSSGVVDKILGVIGMFLGWLTNTLCFGSYIAGICVFAIIIELLMLPFAIKQQKNSIKQAKLRPKEMAIRKKYAGRDDQATRQKVTTEIQELYQRENFNPASGCLPLLLQMPIILALYQVVIDPLRYVLGRAVGMSAALKTFLTTAKAAGGLGMGADEIASNGTISILAEIKKDPNVIDGLQRFLPISNSQEVYESLNEVSTKIPDFMLGNQNLGNMPSFDSWLILVPILTFVVYFFSMKLTKKFTYQPTTNENDQQMACSNKVMDITMPLMSTYIAFIVPALVGIYWMFKSVISTLSRFILCRVMPYPQFTEEDYKAAEREYAGKAPKKGAAATPGQYTYSRSTPMVNGKPRSLFHMDDDDYLAQIAEQERREAEEAERAAAEDVHKKAASGLSRETVKDDTPKNRKKK